MTVYFVKPVEADGPIKIGVAANLASRLRSLECGSPVSLELLVSVEGGAHLERRFHAHFAESRSHGEWFHPTPELLDVIAALKAGVFDINGLPAPKRITPDRTRSNEYLTPQWLYKASLFARLRQFRLRGSDIRYDEARIAQAIVSSSDADLELIKQSWEPLLADLAEQFPSATALRRRRKTS